MECINYMDIKRELKFRIAASASARALESRGGGKTRSITGFGGVLCLA